jgi:hypothetical protein
MRYEFGPQNQPWDKEQVRSVDSQLEELAQARVWRVEHGRGI